MYAQFDRVAQTLTEKLPAVAEHLEAAGGHPGVHRVPEKIWRQSWSNNPYPS